MTDAEALMWSVESDPWFSSSIAAVSVVDRPIDLDLLRGRMRRAVSEIPRLRHRVRTSLGRLTPPEWVPDAEFELDHHIRHVALPTPGSREQLRDLAVRITADPFDRSRPLWQFVVVDGLGDGKGALVSKLHHCVADGQGSLRIAERYMDFSETSASAPSEDVDLDAVLAADGERDGDGDGEARAARAWNDTLAAYLGDHADLVAKLVGGLSLAASDPEYVPQKSLAVLEQVRGALEQLTGRAGEESGLPAGSSLWRTRSRRRTLRTVSVPLARMQATADDRGVHLNDVFMAAVAMGAGAFHRALGAPCEHFAASMVVSTRQGDAVGGNAFTAARVLLPGTATAPADLLPAVAAATSAAKDEVGSEGSIASLAGVANLLPASMLTRLARSQAARVDFATSNVRAASVPTWVAGALIEETYALGPVAGTAFNATLMSYCDRVDVGLHVDPVAVSDPDLLAGAIGEAFAELGCDPL